MCNKKYDEKLNNSKEHIYFVKDMKEIKIIIEKHPEGYVAYPLGLKGVIVGEGETYEEVLKDVKSAIQFHIETFGKEVLEGEEIIETFIAEVAMKDEVPQRST